MKTYVELDGQKVPKLGFGTWQITGAACREAVADALELGYRHIDTAQMYDNEEQVGRAIAASGVERSEIFLTTKVWWENLSYDDCLRTAEESLGRLATDRIDLLLIHWPHEEIPMDEPLRAMRRLQLDRKVRHIGVSNFTLPLLREAASKAPVRCNQVEYHPFLAQDELLDEVRLQNMMLTAYCPLAQGQVMENDTLRRIGDAHGKSPAQVSLRWLLQQDRVAAIPKAESAEHRRSNLDVFDFDLSREEMEEISGLDRGERLVDPEFAPDWGE